VLSTLYSLIDSILNNWIIGFDQLADRLVVEGLKRAAMYAHHPTLSRLPAQGSPYAVTLGLVYTRI